MRKTNRRGTQGLGNSGDKRRRAIKDQQPRNPRLRNLGRARGAGQHFAQLVPRILQICERTWHHWGHAWIVPHGSLHPAPLRARILNCGCKRTGPDGILAWTLRSWATSPTRMFARIPCRWRHGGADHNRHCQRQLVFFMTELRSRRAPKTGKAN